MHVTEHATDFTPERIARLNAEFAGREPAELLSWAVETFGEGLALATSFGPSGVVITHLLSKISPKTTVFYLDTGLLFSETLAVRDRLEERLGLTFTRVAPELSVEAQAEAHGDALWSRSPNECCHLRKVLPLRSFLADRTAWITGIRRDQASTRDHTNLIEWDHANGLVKLNPLALWSNEEVWMYIHLNDLPYNTLHEAGYPSVGCIPCTRPVAPGEHPRAGRWAGWSKVECGIHEQQPKAA